MSTQTTVQDVDPLALERQVCFALATANRVVLAVYRPLLEPLGLTHPQCLVMLALWGWLPAIQSRAVVPKPHQPHAGGHGAADGS
jgi:hypothetical protein